MKKTIAPLLISCMLFSQGVVAAEEQRCMNDTPRSAPHSRYLFNDNGTVKDLKTGLIWMRCTVGMQWDQAQKTCTQHPHLAGWQSTLMTVSMINHPYSQHYLHGFAGMKVWRLPNIKELQSLQETACYQPALNQSAFPNIGNDVGALESTVWSSTPSMNSNEAFSYGLADGIIMKQGVNVGSYAALLVADAM